MVTVACDARVSRSRSRWVARVPLALVGASSPAAVVQYGEAAEEAAAYANPELAPWLELRDKVFGIADDMGVGSEVRVLYYSLSTGQRLGGALTTVGASLPALSGSAILSIAGTLSSIASLVGLVVGFVGLFSDDEDETRDRVLGLAKRWTSRLSIDDMIAEQKAYAAFIDQLNAAAKKVPISGIPSAKVRSNALKLASYYAELKARLSANELALFVSLSNLQRWQAYLDGWNRIKQSDRDKIREYVPIDLGGWLETLISAEKLNATKLAAKLGKPLARVGPGVSGGPVPTTRAIGLGFGLVLVGAAAIAASYLFPAQAAAIARKVMMS